MEKNVNMTITDGEAFFAHELSVNFNPMQFILDFKCVTPRVDPRSKESIVLNMKHNVIMVDPFHAKRIATQLATEINIAVEVGGGYMRTFVLPTRLENNIAYTLNVSEQRVLVSWSDRSYSLPVLASNITGLPVNGTNVIRNVNGVIVFG